MKITLTQPDENCPLARAVIELPPKKGGHKSLYCDRLLFKADKALRAANIMRLTLWRNDKANPFTYVCEVKLND